MPFPHIWSSTLEEGVNGVAQLFPTASVGGIASLITFYSLPSNFLLIGPGSSHLQHSAIFCCLTSVWSFPTIFFSVRNQTQLHTITQRC